MGAVVAVVERGKGGRTRTERDQIGRAEEREDVGRKGGKGRCMYARVTGYTTTTSYHSVIPFYLSSYHSIILSSLFATQAHEGDARLASHRIPDKQDKQDRPDQTGKGEPGTRMAWLAGRKTQDAGQKTAVTVFELDLG